MPAAGDEAAVGLDGLGGVAGLWPMVVLMSRWPQMAWAMCGAEDQIPVLPGSSGR
jgi:hypothetical protein